MKNINNQTPTAAASGKDASAEAKDSAKSEPGVNAGAAAEEEKSQLEGANAELRGALQDAQAELDRVNAFIEAEASRGWAERLFAFRRPAPPSPAPPSPTPAEAGEDAPLGG